MLLVEQSVEVQETFTGFTLSAYAISFLSDDILRLRFVSIDGQLRKLAVVIKMRRSAHSIDMREFEITSEGFVVGNRLRGYRGLTTGVPGPWNAEPADIHDLAQDAESD